MVGLRLCRCGCGLLASMNKNHMRILYRHDVELDLGINIISILHNLHQLGSADSGIETIWIEQVRSADGQLTGGGVSISPVSHQIYRLDSQIGVEPGSLFKEADSARPSSRKRESVLEWVFK